MKDRWLRLIGIPLIGLLLPLAFYPPGDRHLPVAIGCTLLCAWLIWETNRMFIFRLRGWLRWDVHPAWHILVQAVGSITFTMLVVAVADIICYRYIYHEPLEKHVLEESMVLAIFVTLLLNAVYESLYFSHKWRTAFLKAEVLRRENIQSHFESLKNQVSPHFLFNSLNTLAMLIEEDKPLALRFTRELSNVYRYVLGSKDWRLISLQHEVKFAETYAFLLQMRFGDSLIFENHLDAAVMSTSIPPLTLQMLIENAIKHNIISKQKPLTITLENDSRTIWVRNNLQKKTSSEPSTRIGLQNIANRYEYFVDNSVEIKETDSIFEVKLPLIFHEAIRVDVRHLPGHSLPAGRHAIG